MEDLKIKIKRNLMAVYIFIMSAIVICGCGVKYAKVSNALNIQEKRTICRETGSNGTKKVAADYQEIKDNKDLYKNVPVYSKKEKAEIKKYLASLPDNLTAKEAKKKGIVIETYNKIYNKKTWLDFYKYTRQGEKLALIQEKMIICPAGPFKAAIVILKYTTEGDACYTYISFIEGEYYVFNDGSRDKFKAGSWNGYSEAGTFKSLRKIEKVIDCKGEKKQYPYTKYLYTRYMLFKKQGISRKRINKIIKNNSGNNNKYYDIISYNTLIKD